MKRTFRDYKITRTYTKEYKDYHSYIKYLREDFKHRCAYCNLLDTQITTPYEADHFIPQDIFKDEWPELKTTYANLIYSCKKCNGAKSNQYEDDITKKELKNELFYEPEETDYGKVFYRGDDGGIYSDDEKGRDMITRLKLYRPIHNLAWICEITKLTLDKLSVQIKKVGKDSKKGRILCDAREELRGYYGDCIAVFMANYNSEWVQLLAWPFTGQRNCIANRKWLALYFCRCQPRLRLSICGFPPSRREVPQINPLPPHNQQRRKSVRPRLC